MLMDDRWWDKGIHASSWHTKTIDTKLDRLARDKHNQKHTITFLWILFTWIYHLNLPSYAIYVYYSSLTWIDQVSQSIFGSNHSLAPVCRGSMWLIWAFNKRRSSQELQDQTCAPFWIAGNPGIGNPGSMDHPPKTHSFFGFGLCRVYTSRMGGENPMDCSHSNHVEKMWIVQKSRDHVGIYYESIKPCVNPGINYQTFSITAANRQWLHTKWSMSTTFWHLKLVLCHATADP